MNWAALRRNSDCTWRPRSVNAAFPRHPADLTVAQEIGKGFLHGVFAEERVLLKGFLGAGSDRQSVQDPAGGRGDPDLVPVVLEQCGHVLIGRLQQGQEQHVLGQVAARRGRQARGLSERRVALGHAVLALGEQQRGAVEPGETLDPADEDVVIAAVENGFVDTFQVRDGARHQRGAASTGRPLHLGELVRLRAGRTARTRPSGLRPGC